MADKPIGQLNEFPAGAPIDGTNTLLVAQYSNAAYKLTGQRFVNALADLLDGHGGIASIEYTEPASGSLVGTMTITMADETVTEVEINNGKGIVSVAKTSTSGLVDTYTITYNDGTTSTFTVTNGEKGDPGDAWYVHIRYAAHEPTADSDMSTIPDAWIGIYSGTSSTAPTAYTAYAWYNHKGAKGDTGDDAQIDSVTAQYQYHTDGAVAPTGTWYNSVPAASAAVSGETQGKYLWSKIDIAYNNSQHCVFYNTAYQGIDGEGLTGVVKSINSTLTPDGNGNVNIDADAISAIPAPASPSDGAVLMYDAEDGWYAGDASSLGTVKSVNGKNPDGTGNVTVGMSDISGLNTAINAKYAKPSSGIPKSDLASAVQTSLGKADTAYQKSSSGIPKTDLASAVQTSLGRADSAYQKPANGVPETDLDVTVRNKINGAASVTVFKGETLTQSDWAALAPYGFYETLPVTLGTNDIAIAKPADAASALAWNTANIYSVSNLFFYGSCALAQNPPNADINVDIIVIHNATYD